MNSNNNSISSFNSDELNFSKISNYNSNQEESKKLDNSSVFESEIYHYSKKFYHHIKRKKKFMTLFYIYFQSDEAFFELLKKKNYSLLFLKILQLFDKLISKIDPSLTNKKIIQKNFEFIRFPDNFSPNLQINDKNLLMKSAFFSKEHRITFGDIKSNDFIVSKSLQNTLKKNDFRNKIEQINSNNNNDEEIPNFSFFCINYNYI